MNRKSVRRTTQPASLLPSIPNSIDDIGLQYVFKRLENSRKQSLLCFSTGEELEISTTNQKHIMIMLNRSSLPQYYVLFNAVLCWT